MHWIGKFLLWWLTVCTDFWMDMAKLNDTNLLVTSYLIKGPVIFTLHLVWNVNSNILPLSLLLRNIQSNCLQLNGRAVDFYYCMYKNQGHFDDYNFGFNLGYWCKKNNVVPWPAPTKLLLVCGWTSTDGSDAYFINTEDDNHWFIVPPKSKNISYYSLM